MEDRTDLEEYPSPFAHPLEQRGETRSERSLRVMAITTALCLVVGIGAVLITVSANHRTAQGPSVPAVQRAVAVAPAITTPKANGGASGKDTGNSRPSLAYYAQNVDRGMFHPAQSAVRYRLHAAVYHRAPKSAPAQTTEPSILPVTPSNPFTDWSYNGTVKMGNTMVALL